MSKNFYLIITNLANMEHYYTYDKLDINKTIYQFYIKLKLINENEIELLSTLKYSDNLTMSYRIMIEFIKKTYTLFEKHHKIKLTNLINLNNDIFIQLKNNTIESYITTDKTISIDILMQIFNKIINN